MKRVIFCIIGWVLVLGLHAQIVENMRIYTDKDCYVAGEDLWIKVCVTDSLSRGSVLSKVAYVEISDTKLVYAQGKIDLQNGNGWGRIRLPQVMYTGAYQLTAYTRYMRNYPMACFPKKYIALLNTVQTTEEDNVELFTDSITVSQASGNQLSGADLWTDKSVYGNRSKVALTLPNLPADVKELTLSVVRKDYVLKGVPISADGQKNYTSVPERSFAAECEGHIVTGRLMGAPADNVNARLACVGKDIRVFDGQPKADAIYAFYTTGITDMQEIVLTALPEEESPCRLELISPFVGVLAEKLPKVCVSFRKEDLIERGFSAQLHSLLPVDSSYSKSILQQLYDFVPASTYNLDEYVRFRTVRDVFVEFVKGIRISQLEGKDVIRILQPDIRRFSNMKTLVLLDGIPFDDHETILNYDARLIHYIHRYTGKYTFGGELYDGIVSFITHRGTLPDIRLDKNSQMFSYEFPQKRIAFVAPSYNSEKQAGSRLPDFRHTLYWNPEITSAMGTLNFYTSDMNGIYIITLQGISVDGREIRMQSEFVVGANH